VGILHAFFSGDPWVKEQEQSHNLSCDNRADQAEDSGKIENPIPQFTGSDIQ